MATKGSHTAMTLALFDPTGKALVAHIKVDRRGKAKLFDYRVSMTRAVKSFPRFENAVDYFHRRCRVCHKPAIQGGDYVGATCGNCECQKVEKYRETNP